MESTIPSISHLKNQAKILKKELKITHSKALDLAAQQYKFFNWKNYLKVVSVGISSTQEPAKPVFHISFTEWLKKHKNRNSPLGDLATDASRDANWPSYDSIIPYIDYLYSMNAVYGAVDALKRGWKSYVVYIKRKNSPPKASKKVTSVKRSDADSRRVVYVKGAKPIPFPERTVEYFNPGDKAWISYDGSKAFPVTILTNDKDRYTFKIERPLKKSKGTSFLYMDEVRSTPELACSNHVTL